MSKVNVITSCDLNRNTEVRNSRLNCRTVGLLAAGILLSGSIQFANAGPIGKPFIAIDNQLIEVQGAVSSLEEQMNLLVARVTTVEERVDAEAAAIADLQAQNDALTLLVNENMSDTQAIKNKIDFLQQVNVVLHGSIADNTGDIDTQQEQVTANALAISNFQLALLQVENTSISLTDSLQEQIDHNDSLIALLQQEMLALKDEIALKQNLIDGICPDRTAVTEVREDGTLVCGRTGGASGTLLQMHVYKESPSLPSNGHAAIEVSCNPDWTIAGAGHFAGYGWKVIDNYASSNRAELYARNENQYPSTIMVAGTCLRIVP